MDQQDHNDGCRCMACNAGKFKRIDSEAFHEAAEWLQEERDKPVATLDEVLARLDDSGRAALRQVLRAIDNVLSESTTGV